MCTPLGFKGAQEGLLAKCEHALTWRCTLHKSFRNVKRNQGCRKKDDEAAATSEDPGDIVLTPQHSRVELQGAGEV